MDSDVSSTHVAEDTANMHGYLGEIAIGFDFGPSMASESKEESDLEDQIWPIFILFENGDVYCYYTSLHNQASNNMIGEDAILFIDNCFSFSYYFFPFLPHCQPGSSTVVSYYDWRLSLWQVLRLLPSSTLFDVLLAL